jgi:ATP-dependent helicase/nuclease subunit B
MSGFLAMAGPRWFTIPAHRPFLEDLATGIWRQLSPLGPEAIADAVVLLPTRRAARALADAFLKVAVNAGAGRGAVLLPQIRALGDLDEGEPPFEPGDIALDLPPAISASRRRFELAGLVVAHQDLLERRLDANAALDLADALAAFLDAWQIEECADPAAVARLVDGELARHWMVSAAFLEVATASWPRRLADLGVMDVAARRVALTRRLAERWRRSPPDDVMIAAGSTGSAPATADLLAAIARAPRGAVVLPGLDTDLADDAWKEVDASHPQGTLKRLLEKAGVGRGVVAPWDPEAPLEPRGRWRRRLVNEALRPPERTADWLTQIGRLREEAPPDGPDAIAEGLKGLCVIAARAEEEAAAIAALLLREALETPGKTAALITPDDALARRVSGRLTRWAITADSSAGQPLSAAPAAVLAGLLARVAGDPLDPVVLLAILKHPLTRLGLDPAVAGPARVVLERHGLRGARAASWAELEARLRVAGPDPTRSEVALGLLAALREMATALAAPFAEGVARPADAVQALAGVLETLAAGPAGGQGDLWAGQAGEALAQLLAGVIEESGALPPVTPRGFADLLEGLMARERLRAGGASHPRLQILGVLEARLVRADRLILAGLEEGVWPQAAPVDPFLSRPMRESLGLPPPERRVGLSAHDFAQAACAPEVILIHSERSGGAPAVQSRWLWRLQTLAAGAGLTLPGRPEVVAWARALDAPLADPPAFLRPAARPSPRPPAAARPRRLAVTAVERWLRDPYGLYAREILKLRPLDRPDEPVEARARGIAFHAAFERFAREHPEGLPAGAEDLFAGMLLEELRSAGMPTSRMAREHALARNVAPWVIDFERRRRPGARMIVETQGELTFPSPGGAFTLTAKADRIEARGGLGDILDFKTGQAPTAKQVDSGISPQLTLTGAILAAGGFADLGSLTLGELLYVRVNGGRVPGAEHPRGGGDADALAAKALEGLKRRVAWFDREDAPYRSWERPQFRSRFGGDYDHLARLWEWYVMGDPEDGS